MSHSIAAIAYCNLSMEIHNMKDWVIVCPGILVKEWYHQPADAKAKAGRHCVLRKQVRRLPLATGTLLFQDLPDHCISLYVTDPDLPLDQIWNNYNTRVECEPSTVS